MSSENTGRGKRWWWPALWTCKLFEQDGDGTQMNGTYPETKDTSCRCTVKLLQSHLLAMQGTRLSNNHFVLAIEDLKPESPASAAQEEMNCQIETNTGTVVVFLNPKKPTWILQFLQEIANDVAKNFLQLQYHRINMLGQAIRSWIPLPWRTSFWWCPTFPWRFRKKLAPLDLWRCQGFILLGNAV